MQLSCVGYYNNEVYTWDARILKRKRQIESSIRRQSDGLTQIIVHN